jgi:hypothetical protein
MVELLSGYPPYVAAYKASGKVNRDEYEQVVVKRVDEVAHQYGKINFLVLLHTDMDNYSLGAFIEYLKVSFKHLTGWNRMAIVSDEKWLRTAYDILSPLVPGKIKGYRTEEYEAARQWVSEPQLHDENKF